MAKTPKLLATTDQRIVSMTIYNGHLILATEHGVYRLREDDVFEQLQLVHLPDNLSTLKGDSL